MEFKEEHTLEPDELFCCVIFSSGLKEKTFYVTKMQECRKKNVCLFLLLENPRPLSPPSCPPQPQTSYQPT